jgi:choice-of-anchor B domain-containing protein
MRALLLLALAAPGLALAQSDNMTLIGQLDPRPGDSYSDVWTHVGPDGREYALLASWIDGGVNVIDVTDAAPVLEEHVSVSGDGSDIEAYGDYVYITSNFSATSIVDISDPTDPFFVRTFGGDFHTLSIVDGYLYGNGSAGVLIYDLANPANPVQVGQYDPYYVHDVLVRGDVMYTAGIYGEGVDIVDISNKAQPVLIERFNYPGSGAHNVCADASGDYIYVGDEIGTGNWTRIFDVSDPHDVEQVGQIIVDANSVVHNCHTKDGLLYLAHYGRGVWVFDITDPVNPEQVAFYDGPAVSSVWTVNPHLPSGKVVASDMSNGLLVLRIDDLPAAVTASIEPVNPPVVLPPAGGPFSFRASLTNTGGQSLTVDAWVAAVLPNGADYSRPVVGPRTVTLGPGQTLGPLTLSARVPASAPPGEYTIELRVGDYPSVVNATDSFTLTKQAAALASAAVGEAALAAYPNPFADRSVVRFTLETAADVRLAVYDTRGREVAVLVDGALSAGAHEAAFEGAGLPSGTYFALLEAGGRVERRALTLVR